ncbi:hypothetical protein DFJ74DRAFT_753524 [Hyaloraphidium curvatum]|nr:hypothetical protein DFJ74DRAFT_753524 [Hyaloraphidium curvatum]
MANSKRSGAAAARSAAPAKQLAVALAPAKRPPGRPRKTALAIAPQGPAAPPADAAKEPGSPDSAATLAETSSGPTSPAGSAARKTAAKSHRKAEVKVNEAVTVVAVGPKKAAKKKAAVPAQAPVPIKVEGKEAANVPQATMIAPATSVPAETPQVALKIKLTAGPKPKKPSSPPAAPVSAVPADGATPAVASTSASCPTCSPGACACPAKATPAAPATSSEPAPPPQPRIVLKLRPIGRPRNDGARCYIPVLVTTDYPSNREREHRCSPLQARAHGVRCDDEGKIVVGGEKGYAAVGGREVLAGSGGEILWKVLQDGTGPGKERRRKNGGAGAGKVACEPVEFSEDEEGMDEEEADGDAGGEMPRLPPTPARPPPTPAQATPRRSPRRFPDESPARVPPTPACTPAEDWDDGDSVEWVDVLGIETAVESFVQGGFVSEDDGDAETLPDAEPEAEGGHAHEAPRGDASDASADAQPHPTPGFAVPAPTSAPRRTIPPTLMPSPAASPAASPARAIPLDEIVDMSVFDDAHPRTPHAPLPTPSPTPCKATTPRRNLTAPATPHPPLGTRKRPAPAAEEDDDLSGVFAFRLPARECMLPPPRPSDARPCATPRRGTAVSALDSPRPPRGAAKQAAQASPPRSPHPQVAYSPLFGGMDAGCEVELDVAGEGGRRKKARRA